MKTNRTLRRLAIIAGTICVTAPALAETAPMATAQPQQIKAPAPVQPRIVLAALSCTRVGNRMVC